MNNSDNHSRTLEIDYSLLKELEMSLDTINPENGKIPIKLLGFGEISIVFEIINDPHPDIAYKRLPIFDTEEQVVRHIDAYNEYNQILKNNVGLIIPISSTSWIPTGKSKNKGISLYCIQKKVNPASIGNRVIHQINDEQIEQLVYLIMKELHKVWKFNNSQNRFQIGLDGQISNWSINDYKESNPEINSETKLTYLDTSTPLYRINGEEAMEAILFLKSAPSFLRWVLKLFFLDEVVDRYYDWRLVTIDLLANFYKEQKTEIIPRLIKNVNDYYNTEAGEFDIKNITLEELKSYYKGDKRIWVIFQGMRRLDRFLKTKILRKKYDFYLPDKIDR